MTCQTLKGRPVLVLVPVPVLVLVLVPVLDLGLESCQS